MHLLYFILYLYGISLCSVRPNLTSWHYHLVTEHCCRSDCSLTDCTWNQDWSTITVNILSFKEIITSSRNHLNHRGGTSEGTLAETPTGHRPRSTDQRQWTCYGSLGRQWKNRADCHEDESQSRPAIRRREPYRRSVCRTAVLLGLATLADVPILACPVWQVVCFLYEVYGAFIWLEC